MTAAERREKARLRSERWRRARGIMPRRPARRPWLALGISRSTYYRRREKAQKLRLLAAAQKPVVSTAFDRASAFVRELQAELAEVARCQAITAAILVEMSAEHRTPTAF